jgi:hypothetical protein
MQEAEVLFNKSVGTLFEETGEERISKAVSKLLKIKRA